MNHEIMEMLEMLDNGDILSDEQLFVLAHELGYSEALAQGNPKISTTQQYLIRVGTRLKLNQIEDILNARYPAIED